MKPETFPIPTEGNASDYVLPNCPVTALLSLCDVVRDDTLPELGVRLEDHEGDAAF